MNEIIVKRYKNPVHKGAIQSPDASSKDDNSSCGDHIQIDLLFDDNRIVTNAMFSGNGCSISIASADLLMEQIIGRSIEEIERLSKYDYLAAINLDIPVRRENCALLPFEILMTCLNNISVK